MSVTKLIELVRDSAQEDIQLSITVKNGGIHWALDKMPKRKDGHPKQLIPYRATGSVYADDDVDDIAHEILLQLAENALAHGALLPERG